MTTHITRRQFAASALVAAGVLALPIPASVLAASQSDMASLSLPTLDIGVTPDAFEGIPETIEAGRYLVNLSASDDVESYGAVVAFLQPYMMTAEEFFAAISESGDDSDILPAFVYQSHFAGGVAAMSGATASAVLDLTPGEWIVWGDDPSASQAPVVLTVTGEFPETPVEVPSDITFTLVDFAIMVDGNLTAGEHTIMVDNQGAQPHFIDFSTLPPGTTNDDIDALFNTFMTGTPEATVLGEDDIVNVGFSPTQSIDVQTWMTLTLEAGTYLATCWFPTAGVGDPHAFHGMSTVFDVT